MSTAFIFLIYLNKDLCKYIDLFQEEKEEIGKCCFCDEQCNIHSQLVHGLWFLIADDMFRDLAFAAPTT